MARFLGVPVWQLDDVPEFRRQEALVILRARTTAAREMVAKMKGAQPSFDLGLLLGEF